MLKNTVVGRKALLALAALFLAVAPPTTAIAQTVTTDTGTFIGIPSPSDPAAVNVFFGIRYAASPAGAARCSLVQERSTILR